MHTISPSPALLVSINWTLIAIAALMIFARLHLRLKINKQGLQISDSFIILAWFSTVATWAIGAVLAHMGVLRQGVDMLLLGFSANAKTFRQAKIFSWVTLYTTFITLYLCKAAILAFYLHLFPEVMRVRRFILWAVIVYTASGFIVNMMLTTFICYPIKRNWATDSTVCFKALPLSFNITWGLHFSSDILIFMLPFTILYKLQLRTSAKIGVYFIFGLGFISIVFSLMRFLAIHVLHDRRVPPSMTIIWLWNGLDSNVSLIVACLPSLRPYLRGARRSKNDTPQEFKGSSFTRESGNGTASSSVKSSSAIQDHITMENMSPI